MQLNVLCKVSSFNMHHEYASNPLWFHFLKGKKHFLDSTGYRSLALLFYKPSHFFSLNWKKMGTAISSIPLPSIFRLRYTYAACKNGIVMWTLIESLYQKIKIKTQTWISKGDTIGLGLHVVTDPLHNLPPLYAALQEIFGAALLTFLYHGHQRRERGIAYARLLL